MVQALGEQCSLSPQLGAWYEPEISFTQKPLLHLYTSSRCLLALLQCSSTWPWSSVPEARS